MKVSVNKFKPYINNLLKNRDGESYPDDYLLSYFQDAIFRISLLRPDIFSSYIEISTQKNNVLQVLDEDIQSIIDIHAVDSKYAIMERRKTEMDEGIPDWVSHDSGVPRQWMRDKKSTNRFYLYPAPKEEITLAIQCLRLPMLETVDTEFDFNMLYQPALVDAVVFLAESIDSEESSSQKSSKFYGIMKKVLGEDSKEGDKIEEAQN